MSLSLKDDVFNAVYGYTPKFSKPTPPPHPKTGSKVQPKKTTCTYVTPCGWCTKWDKKCDMKIGCDKDKDLNKIKFGCGLILTDLHSTTSSGVRKENTK